jgi:hypothetical protein
LSGLKTRMMASTRTLFRPAFRYAATNGTPKRAAVLTLFRLFHLYQPAISPKSSHMTSND